MCGQGQSHIEASCEVKELSSAMMQRLFEIRGARKILLGTANNGSYTVTSSPGLLDTLIGDGQPSLLSTADVAELEYLEERVLTPSKGESLPIDEWYRTLTRLLNEIHTKISICLAHDIRTLKSEVRMGSSLLTGSWEARPNARPSSCPPMPIPCHKTPRCNAPPESLENAIYPVKEISREQMYEPCGCKAGLKLVLLRLLEMLET
eukprot:CAMPEP_0169185028 /NCGR_PEP_ID=MMETSP1016-20121227/1556_1 /TAXON_ID=342587 /ORGANISM="Karlodinium micrum, Strain CCMP2283" /LENGTH=205 /DNA_ID=CAMNT_0009260661 /DNA_START=347 /DNA_END=964 /DNA_ORIENTATION=+